MQMAVSIEELAERLNRYRRPVVFLGDGVPVYENVLAEKLTVPYSFAPAYMNRQRAAVVGTLAIQYYKSGKFETAEEHRPDYLRVSQAERERAQREKEAEIIVRELKVEDSAAVAEMEQQIFRIHGVKKRVGDCAAEAVCLLCGGKSRTSFGISACISCGGRSGDRKNCGAERSTQTRGCR